MVNVFPAQANATLTENSFELMRLVYHFVVLEDTKDERRLSLKTFHFLKFVLDFDLTVSVGNINVLIQLLEGVLGLLEVLLVFADSPEGEGWAAMAEMGLGVVLNCAASHNLELCAMATAKLHSLVQTRPQAPLPESCHLLASLDTILTRTIESECHLLQLVNKGSLS
ncbi:NBEAL1 [Cordylochernes scorpioides]|uniref:NBEAL1 n=1 Tax=Cordylochernes scorpioides TaxID=51811 RepID=A0ABY6LAN4_9ARAC|nr:NBEAL1 [Cordylochernes scorpioides]